MINKTEKTSHNLHRQHRLNIFCRNPLLLKILAWLGCLGFIGSQGIVWADLKPISVSQTEAKALISASPSVGSKSIKLPIVESYGPSVPTAWRQSPAQIKVDRLPNREIPIPIAPATAKTQATGKTIRPQHVDILESQNYTVGVNGTPANETSAEAFVNIPVPAPRQGTIPPQSREVSNAVATQVPPRARGQQSAISKSTPTTSLNHIAPYRAVPKVPSLAANVIKSSQQTAIKVPTPIAVSASLPVGGQRPVSGLKPVIVTPMKPSAIAKALVPAILVPDRTLGASPTGQAEASITIPVPAPRTQVIKVPAVAQLPQITNPQIPTVPPIPTVRAAAVTNYQTNSVTYVDRSEQSENSGLIYPLSSPAPITSGFGWRTHPITGSRRFHSGVDIGAAMGAPVVAAASGIIITAGRLGGYGNAIVIQHNGVQQTLYGHLSEVFVQPGQRIEQGTVIGRVGSTGNSTGPHLHFESRTATADGWIAVDPGDEVKYALDNLRRAMPFAQRNSVPGIN